LLEHNLHQEPLRWINYKMADEISKLKSIGGTAHYSIPEATQWMAGWVAANELGRLGDGAARQRYKKFFKSFNEL
jgi:hypothetical protein